MVASLYYYYYFILFSRPYKHVKQTLSENLSCMHNGPRSPEMRFKKKKKLIKNAK